MLKMVGFCAGAVMCIVAANTFVHMDSSTAVSFVEVAKGFVLAIVGVAFLSMSLR